MNDQPLSKLQNGLPSFSKGQRAIAQYILRHYDKAAFMTASRLGEAAGVSESTVVRFASELGYEGYPALQKSLQEVIRNRLTAVQRMEVTVDRLGGQDVLHTVLLSDIEKIRLTLLETDAGAFERAADALAAAQNVYILGARSSASLAGFLGFYLNLLFDRVKVLSASSVGELIEQMPRIGPDDVLVGISFPRYSHSTVQVMRHAREMGARVIALTDSRHSPLVPLSDHALLAKSDMASFADSLVAPLSLINALIVALGMRKKEEVSFLLSKLETVWDAYDVYEKSDQI